jgi:hypothetical protein
MQTSQGIVHKALQSIRQAYTDPQWPYISIWEISVGHGQFHSCGDTILARHSHFLCLTNIQLSCASNDARSDDTGSLMREGLIYMLKMPEADQFNPPLLKQHGKIARGWNHPQTARLLCPMRMLDIFDNDPPLVMLMLFVRWHVTSHRSFMDKVKEGQINITAAKFPLFLYDESMLDPTRKSQGCLWGYYLKRVCSPFWLLSVEWYFMTRAGLSSHIHWTVQCHFCKYSQRYQGSKR